MNAPSTVVLSRIVRDPALQCRTKLDQATVDRYVEVLDQLPPVRLIRDDEQLLLVDGWHRFAAHEKAGKTSIEAVVEDGNRRSAILAAVRANSSHGLPRSHEDARRAVRVLLMDSEWCMLTDRKLAALADVSHTHVANQRKHYGVKAGQVLTEAQANRLDGKMPPKWEKLAAAFSADYDRRAFDTIRAARTPAELARVRPEHWNRSMLEVFALRAEELAVSSWPWPEDTTGEDQRARLARLDTVRDLESAAGCIALSTSEIDHVYKLLEWAGDIEKAFYPSNFTDRFKGRPKLEARLQERIAEMAAKEAAKPKDAWELAREIARTENPGVRAVKVLQADGQTLQNLCQSWLKELRAGRHDALDALKTRVRRGDVHGMAAPKEVDRCVVPGCSGWVLPAKEPYARRCTTCEMSPSGWMTKTKAELTNVSRLLLHRGYGFVVDGVVVDAATVEAIKRLRKAALLEGSKVVKLPGELGAAVRGLTVQTLPLMMCVDPATEEKEGAEPDEEEDLEDGDEEEEEDE